MKKTPKTPLLADEYLASSTFMEDYYDRHERNFGKTTRANLLLAKRFVLDDTAAEAIGIMIREQPLVIANAIDFAMPPFEKCWVELPFDMLYRGITGRSVSRNHAYRIGFLFVGNTVRSILNEGQGAGPVLAPLEYLRNVPWKDGEESRFATSFGLSPEDMDNFIWGIGEGSEEGLQAMRERHSARLIFKVSPKVSAEMQQEKVEFVGDMRNFIAMLLFINRTRAVQRRYDVPHQHTVSRSRSGVLLSHTVITLSGDPLPIVERLVPGESVWRRLHDVRGHFCHDRVTRESPCDEHQWEEDVTDHRNLRWKCTTCGGQRWWRKEHKRGHEDKGLVTSEYRVKE